MLGEDHLYYPDLELKRTYDKDVIIEVKSHFTLFDDIGTNYFKFVSAEAYYKSLGKLFWLWLKDDSGIHLIKTPSKYLSQLLLSQK